MKIIYKILTLYSQNSRYQWYWAGAIGLILIVLNYPLENGLPRYADF